MKRLVRAILVAGCLLGSASASSASNIIVNGSFETPACPPCVPGGNWGLFASIPGWFAAAGQIEVGAGTLYGISGYDGAQVLELDSTANSTVQQDVITGAGTYTLSFLFADRGTAPYETFNVYWNSVLLAVPPAAVNPPFTAMQLYTTTVIANNGLNSLQFQGTGVSDGLGILIDDVKLEQVPDGGLTAVLLGLSMAGLSRLRRKF